MKSGVADHFISTTLAISSAAAEAGQSGILAASWRGRCGLIISVAISDGATAS